MRRLTAFLAALLTACALTLAASASRLSEAGAVSWPGGGVFLDESAGELIALGTDEVLLNGVTDLQRDGETLWARTADAWYRIAEDGALTAAGYSPDPDAYETVSHGFVISGTDGAVAVHRLADGREVLRTDAYTDVQVCRDERTGEIFICSARGDILRADGTRAVAGGTLSELVRDCRFSFVCDGHAFGYLSPYDETCPQAAVIDLAAGEIVTVFDGWWCDYVGWGMIYDDGTAVIAGPDARSRYDPLRVVRWTDGETLLDLRGTDSEIFMRYAGEPCYRYRKGTAENEFRPGASAAAPAPDPAPFPEYVRDESGRISGIRFLNADGQPVGETVWRDADPYESHDADLLSPTAEYFNPDGGAEVIGFDGRRGILGLDGAMILPAVFDRIGYVAGEGYLTLRDGVWEIFDPNGHQID